LFAELIQSRTYPTIGTRGAVIRLCWSVAGVAIDRAVERLFLETMVPSEFDLSLAVEREVQ
jgi:hypothetical protein